MVYVYMYVGLTFPTGVMSNLSRVTTHFCVSGRNVTFPYRIAESKEELPNDWTE